MSIREWFNKPDDTVMIPLHELEEARIEKEKASRQNQYIIEESAKLLAESESVNEMLRNEIFEEFARYGKLLKLVRECVESKKYKPLKDYITAHDNGEMWLMSDEYQKQQDEQIEELLKEIDEEWSGGDI